MLEGISGALLGAGASGSRIDPQKAFETLELNKSGASRSVDVAREIEGASSSEKSLSQSASSPPPSTTGGVDAQSLVQGLLASAETEQIAQDSTAAAQSLYIATKGQFTG